MTLLVRRVRVMDLPALEAIEARRLAASEWREPWLQRFSRLVEEALRDEPEGLLIADLDGRVIGAAVVRQGTTMTGRSARSGEVAYLGVDALAGDTAAVLRRLLRESEAYLRSRGCASIRLRLSADDPHLELLQRSGYRVAAHELERALG